MLALVVVLLVAVLLLAVVVTGLLRSHADIIRSLHSLGVGVGDPTPAHASSGDDPVSMGSIPPQPRLPAERSSAVHDLEGFNPAGDPVVVSISTAPLTLLAFVTSTCESCARLWESFSDPSQRHRLPAGVRVVLVTKGPEWESPALIQRKAPPGVNVIMSTAAWTSYEIPGSPYFVLVDGDSGARRGEGVGHDLAQIADLLNRAGADDGPPVPAGGSQSAPFGLGLNGAEREARNDEVLRAAGIGPGHPSLYPGRAGE